METINSCLGTGGAGKEIKDHFSLSGTPPTSTSTYKWQWVPPNNALGQPDLINFPLPSLFVLGKGYSVLSSTLVSSSTTDLKVNGSASSGIGTSGPLTISSCPAFQTQTDYAILTPGLDTGLVYKQLLFPSVTYDASGVVNTNSGQYPTAPEGESQNWASVRDDLYPLILAVPDPFARPDLGDGKNQFVYDATTPDGILTLPVTISVSGCSSAETAWLMRGSYRGQQVDVTWDLPPETKPTGPGNLWDQTLCPVVPNDQIIGKHGTLLASVDGLLFTGLPKANAGFAGVAKKQGDPPPGFHLATLVIQNQADAVIHPSELAHFQTFFLGLTQDANKQNVYLANHPIDKANPLTGGSTIPNWYYYYNQVYPATGNYDAAASVSYTEHNGTVHIANDIVNTHLTPHNAIVATALQNVQYTWDEPVFVLVDPTDTKQATYVRLAGYLTVPGVLDYIFTCAHENGHRTADLDGSIMLANQSTDLDGVSDDWENHHHMNSSWPDTTALKKGG